MKNLARSVVLIIYVLLANVSPTLAQANYEIQVYGSDLVEPKHTMIELHSNYTLRGTTTTINGVLPTQDAFHETLEITHGFNHFFECGFYLFMAAQHSYGWQIAGSHIRPRFSVPESYKWPFGFSISQEFGYLQGKFAEDSWTYELRPILDKKWGKYYLGFNPALEKSLHGSGASAGWEFSPNVKFSIDVTPKVSLGVEYYGSYGPLSGFDPWSQRSQQLFPSIDLNIAPDLEFNFGVGFGLTSSTDHMIVKMILGKRMNW